MPEQFFPPCVKLISNGLADGRKRSLFILINFLTSLGWGYKEIEDYLKEWNKKNTEQLRENYFVGQLRYHKAQKKNILAFGPYSADSFFTQDNLQKFDGILAMYHDQGLAPFKSLYKTIGANISLGLPFLRLSVDHGTAFELYGNNKANYMGCYYVLKQALKALNRNK